MRQHANFELDKIDLTMIQELARDGRMPVVHLATKTGISQRAASARLKRIIDERIIKVVAVPALPLSKQNLSVTVGFTVNSEHDIHKVAEKLASFPNFRSVALATGPYDIVTWAFFRGLDALSAFLRHEIGKIPGITGNETLIHMETIKNVLSYPISAATPQKYKPAHQKKSAMKRYVPDELDMTIIEELQKDGRMPVVELAKKLGVSRVSAAKRLQRLLSEGITEIIAVTEPGSLGYEMTAMIGIKVVPGAVDDVANKLASFNSVHFVTIILGHYDILLGVHFSEILALSDFLRDGLGNIPGIVKTETMIYLEVIRSPWDGNSPSEIY